MKVRFQYTDWDEWEGPPEAGHSSPDKGVVRMWAIDDFGNILAFTYDDLYYFYPKDGGWLFGSGTPKREFILKEGQRGCTGEEVPIVLPEGAVIRHGETVSQEAAVAFGLIESVDTKTLHEKRKLSVECEECGE